MSGSSVCVFAIGIDSRFGDNSSLRMSVCQKAIYKSGLRVAFVFVFEIWVWVSASSQHYQLYRYIFFNRYIGIYSIVYNILYLTWISAVSCKFSKIITVCQICRIYLCVLCTTVARRSRSRSDRVRNIYYYIHNLSGRRKVGRREKLKSRARYCSVMHSLDSFG